MIEFIKAKIHLLFKSSFSKNVAFLMTGTAISQLLSILSYPIITRVFTSDDFGLYVLFNSILGVLTVVGALRYEYSIPIQTTKSKALNALFMSFIILLSLVFILFSVLYFFGRQLFMHLDAESLNPYKYLIVLAVLFAGIYSILNQWALRVKDFKKLSITRVSRSISLNGSQIIFGFLKLGGIGLIIGKIIGEFSGNIVLLKQILKSEKKIFSYFSIRRIKHLIFKHRKFPLYSVPSQLFNKTGLELPVFFLSSLFGASVVGHYGLAHLIVSLPMILIGNAVGEVFYSEAASIGRNNPEALLKRSNNLLKQLSIIGLIPLIVLMLFGPLIFSYIFGNEWEDSGKYAQVLAILVFFRFIFTPISRVFEVFEQQIQAFFLDLLRLISVFVTFSLVALYNLTAYEAIILYSILMVFIYFITYIVARRIILRVKNNCV